MTSPVTAVRDQGVLVVRLTDQSRRNAIGVPFADALWEAVGGDLGDVGAVALLADGDHFCVGGDVRAMAAAPDRPAFLADLAGRLHRSMLALQSAPPVVVGVRGWAAGAGMSLVLAGDVVVAGESAAFQPGYGGIGLTPDGGMSWNLPRAVGARVARSLVLRNAPVQAEQALALGIVDRVVADAEVEDTVLGIARDLAAGPRGAHVAAKALLRESEGRSYADQLAAEAEGIAARSGTPDGIEGVTAFSERRPPRFGQG